MTLNYLANDLIIHHFLWCLCNHWWNLAKSIHITKLLGTNGKLGRALPGTGLKWRNIRRSIMSWSSASWCHFVIADWFKVVVVTWTPTAKSLFSDYTPKFMICWKIASKGERLQLLFQITKKGRSSRLSQKWKDPKLVTPRIS